MEQIELSTINAIPSSNILLVGSFMTSADQETKEPSKMVLDVAINKEKAYARVCEFPIFLPADGNYKSLEHYKMLNLFKSGHIFVAVQCTDLKIFRKKEGEFYKYFGTANTFTVADTLELNT